MLEFVAGTINQVSTTSKSRVPARILPPSMSAQNGDTVTQEEALDEEEDLALGVEKLKVVRPF